MINAWILTSVVMTAVASVGKDLVSLLRYRLRRTSIERVVATVAAGSRVIDREPDGAVIDVTVERISHKSASLAPLTPGQPAA